MFDDLKYKLQGYWNNFIGNPFFENIRIKYGSLPSREQRLIKYATIGLGVFIVFYILYSMSAGLSEKEKTIDESVVILQKLDELNNYITSNEYLIKKKKKASTSKYVSLVDLVEKQEIAAKIKIDSRVDLKELPRKEVKGAKYTENSAAVKYDKLTIKQIKALLLGIETGEASAKINALKITRRTDDIRYLNIEFEIISRIAK